MVLMDLSKCVVVQNIFFVFVCVSYARRNGKWEIRKDCRGFIGVIVLRHCFLILFWLLRFLLGWIDFLLLLKMFVSTATTLPQFQRYPLFNNKNLSNHKF